MQKNSMLIDLVPHADRYHHSPRSVEAKRGLCPGSLTASIKQL